MVDINQYAPRSGRLIKEDNTIVNEANGINADGSRNVQLTGRNVVEEVAFNALAITDTAAKWSNALSIFTTHKTKMIEIYSSLDQSVAITLFNNMSGIYYGVRNKENTAYSVAVAANLTCVITITPNEWPILGTILPASTKLQAVCSVAPTTGALTVIIKGVQ